MFLSNYFFFKEKKALAFNRDRCCHLVFCFQLIFFHWVHIAIHMGSAKAYGREPRSWLGRVFHFILGCSCISAIEWPIQAPQHLKLKTRPRFCPVSLSISSFECCAWDLHENSNRRVIWPLPSLTTVIKLAYSQCHSEVFPLVSKGEDNSAPAKQS